MNLDPITPYNIIEELKKRNAELESEVAELKSKLKESENDTLADSSN